MMLTATELAGLTGPFLSVVAPGRGSSVHDLVFADEQAWSGIGDVLLGAGISTQQAAVALVGSAGESGAAAVILRDQWATDREVATAAVAADLVLLALDPAMSWAQLVTLLQDVIHRSAASASGVHASLFTMADAAAQILDAPVTIEDSRSRVLAYSLHHEGVDSARVSTIIGRRVPERIVSHFRSQGVFRKMARSDDPIYVPEGPDGRRPRLIVPIRAGGEWLGSIWAVVSGPASAEQIEELSAATRVLALHLLRLRTEANLDERLSAEQVRAALSDPSARLPAGLIVFPCRVVALAGGLAGGPDPDHEVSSWTSSLQRNGWSHPIVAHLGSAVFVIAADAGPAAEPGTWRWLQRVVEAAASETSSLRAGVSPLVGESQGLPTARAQAAEALAIQAGSPLTMFEEEWAELAIRRATRALDSWQEISGPLARLIEIDAARGTDLLGTLAAFLDHPGSPAVAAKSLTIHPNTLRYRMKKITDLVHLDQAGPTKRLALQLLARAALASRDRGEAQRS